MEQMRISIYFKNFTPYEVMTSITAVREILILVIMSLLQLLEKTELFNTEDKIKDTIR